MASHSLAVTGSRGPLDLLLAEGGVSQLPSGLPIDLARLPLVRPTNVLDEKTRDAEGHLPLETWETRLEYTDEMGGRRQAVIRGSPAEGLPYGADGDALLATCLLVVEDGDAEGYVQNPSLNRLVAALGREWDGQQGRRMMEALSRFASVTIETLMEEVGEEEAEKLLAGDRDPVAPRPVNRRRAHQAKIKLLNLIWEMEQVQLSDGTQSERVRIRELQLAPQLLRYAIGGGVAWIDPEVFVRLSRQPIARSLYLYVASEVAMGRTSPWSYSVEALSVALGLRLDVRPARRAKQLEEAAQSLVEAQVLEGYQTEGSGRNLTLSLTRGPLLDVARRLRGVGLFELEDTKKQVVLLGMLGVHSTRARELIREGGHDLAQVLAYLKFKAETEPQASEIQNPAGFVVRALQRGVSFDSDDRFVRWLESRLVEGETPEETRKAHAERPAPEVAASVAPLRPEMTADSLEGEPEAIALWADVRPRISVLAPGAFVGAMLESVAPWKVQGETLWLRSRNSYAAAYLDSRVLPLLAEEIATRTGGQVCSVRLQQVEGAFETLSAE